MMAWLKLLVTLTFTVVIETKYDLSFDDVTAIVGEKFDYQLGDEEFQSTYKIVRISKRGEKTLPKWLHFDANFSMLIGYPQAEDVGMYTLRLKAQCIDPLSASCQDKFSKTFSIFVVEPLKSAESRGRLRFSKHGQKHGRNDYLVYTNKKNGNSELSVKSANIYLASSFTALSPLANSLTKLLEIPSSQALFAVTVSVDFSAMHSESYFSLLLDNHLHAKLSSDVYVDVHLTTYPTLFNMHASERDLHETDAGTTDFSKVHGIFQTSAVLKDLKSDKILQSNVIEIYESSSKDPEWTQYSSSLDNHKYDAYLPVESSQDGMPVSIWKKYPKHCREDEVSYYASLLLYLKDDLSETQMKNVVTLWAGFVNKNLNTVSISKTEIDLMSLQSDGKFIVTAGPGNVVESLSDSYELTWHVACGYFEQISDFTRVLQHNVDVGRVTEELGYSVIAWFVYTDRPVPRRWKRQAHKVARKTVTPTFSPPAPTTISDLVRTYSDTSLVSLTTTSSYITSTAISTLRSVPVTSSISLDLIYSSSVMSSVSLSEISVILSTKHVLDSIISSEIPSVNTTKGASFTGLESTKVMTESTRSSIVISSSVTAVSTSLVSSITTTKVSLYTVHNTTLAPSFSTTSDTRFLSSFTSSIQLPILSTSLTYSSEQITISSTKSPSFSTKLLISPGPVSVQNTSYFTPRVSGLSSSLISESLISLSSSSFKYSIIKSSSFTSLLTHSEFSSVSSALISSTYLPFSNTSLSSSLFSTGLDFSVLPLSSLISSSTIQLPFRSSSSVRTAIVISTTSYIKDVPSVTFFSGSSLPSLISSLQLASSDTTRLKTSYTVTSQSTVTTSPVMTTTGYSVIFSSSTSQASFSSHSSDTISLSRSLVSLSLKPGSTVLSLFSSVNPSQMLTVVLSTTSDLYSAGISTFRKSSITSSSLDVYGPGIISTFSKSSIPFSIILKTVDLSISSTYFSFYSVFKLSSSQSFSFSSSTKTSFATNFITSISSTSTVSYSVTNSIISLSIQPSSDNRSKIVLSKSGTISFSSMISEHMNSALSSEFSSKFAFSSFISTFTFETLSLNTSSSFSSSIPFTAKSLTPNLTPLISSSSPRSFPSLLLPVSTSISTSLKSYAITLTIFSSNISESGTFLLPVSRSLSSLSTGMHLSSSSELFLLPSSGFLTTTSSGFVSMLTSGLLSATLTGLLSPTSSRLLSATSSGLLSPTSSGSLSPTSARLFSPTSSRLFSPTSSGLLSPTSFGIFSSPSSRLLSIPSSGLSSSPSSGLFSKKSSGLSLFQSTRSGLFSSLSSRFSSKSSLLLSKTSSGFVATSSGLMSPSLIRPTPASSLTSWRSSSLATTAAPDAAPVLKNSIDHIKVLVGRYFELRIPSSTFEDQEDGNTRNLSLTITLVYGKPLPADGWLKFNEISQTLYGIPLKSDTIGQNVVNKFILTAKDSQGQLVKDAISLTYEYEMELNHRLIVKLNGSFEKFTGDRENLIKFARNIEGFYGDKSLDFLTFSNIEKGSVIVTWSNNSLLGMVCKKSVIQDLYDKLMVDNETIVDTFTALFLDYTPLSINLEFSGVCLLPPTSLPPPTKSPVTDSDDKLWIEIILPALIAILVIVIIALLLLISCRHRRPRKNIKDSDKPAFLEDRRPIIFPEELEMVDSSLKPKTPLVLPADYLRETPPAVPLHSRPAPEYLAPELDDSMFPQEDGVPPPPPPHRRGQGQGHNSDPPPYRLPPPYFNPHRST